MEVTAREFLEGLAALPKPVGMGQVFALAKASADMSPQEIERLLERDEHLAVGSGSQRDPLGAYPGRIAARLGQRHKAADINPGSPDQRRLPVVTLAGLPIASPDTTSSTRLFSWRPAELSLEATGEALPNPLALTDAVATPCSTR